MLAWPLAPRPEPLALRLRKPVPAPLALTVWSRGAWHLTYLPDTMSLLTRWVSHCHGAPGNGRMYRVSKDVEISAICSTAERHVWAFLEAILESCARCIDS